MAQYTYLAINFFTVIICFLFSFHPKIKFHKHFKAFLTASVLVAIFFIVWDVWFTQKGAWWFNDEYLIGSRLFGLPVEELMFFICIPFSCVFTYYCVDKFFKFNWTSNVECSFVIISITVLLSLSVYFEDKIYPFITFLTTAISLFILYFILKVKWIGKASFIYLILMPGFLTVNGILTGTGLNAPIVNYNPEHIIGLRIFTIPIEDTAYGFEMVLWNIYFFYQFNTEKKETQISTVL